MINAIILSTDLAAKAGGYTIAVVGWVIVFAALIGLVIIFMAIPKLLEFNIKNKLKKEGKPEENINIEANVNVAIAMGIHMYLNELHDEESNIITIKNAQKQYSPWSSKIYGVQNQPRR
ncbi:OadG family protein [uncultured Sanguibacteroides sp.]|uniref:OadG family protein n=1 Tax=uncultured Sanguibacteroides sp. TaxID=1635151 RepID=UPI0025CE1897|nr:OadG family protein [uncultured Sanguibacteroides sp.]